MRDQLCVPAICGNKRRRGKGAGGRDGREGGQEEHRGGAGSRGGAVSSQPAATRRKLSRRARGAAAPPLPPADRAQPPPPPARPVRSAPFALSPARPVPSRPVPPAQPHQVHGGCRCPGGGPALTAAGGCSGSSHCPLSSPPPPLAAPRSKSRRRRPTGRPGTTSGGPRPPPPPRGRRPLLRAGAPPRPRPAPHTGTLRGGTGPGGGWTALPTTNMEEPPPPPGSGAEQRGCPRAPATRDKSGRGGNRGSGTAPSGLVDRRGEGSAEHKSPQWGAFCPDPVRTPRQHHPRAGFPHPGWEMGKDRQQQLPKGAKQWEGNAAHTATLPASTKHHEMPCARSSSPQQGTFSPDETGTLH
ncbi:uncharacterized protein LOC133220236 [Neopsephotus bourkii]|uniref:uncharacterized protein LOC133220236 n=1 Tax=Neopsephotus bourkii TaxID=309878 RepID=UPI002AA5A08A|nr:uncharacterized protein LOC133220236 [Neopsephotus bourkii]